MLEIVKKVSPLIQLIAKDNGVVVSILEARACDILTKRGKLREHVLSWMINSRGYAYEVEVLHMEKEQHAPI